MKHGYMVSLLSLILPFVHSSAQVPLIAGSFTFLTTRYSNYIGNFDKDCSISAPMVKLAPGENLCDLDSIETNVTGRVLITFGCYEETAYENAIELGAVALIDSVFMPPGSYHSVHNSGQSFNKREVPFLQVGDEFFELFGEEEFSPGYDLLDGTQININGCADITPVIECYEIYTYVQIFFSFVAFFGVFLAYKAVRDLKSTPSTRPRLVLIIYELLLLVFNAVVLFFGLSLRQNKNWVNGSIISAQTKDIFGNLQIVGVLQGSLMNAIYWNALRKGCFLKEAITSEYWNKNFFHSPWQLVTLTFSIFFCIEYSILLVKYYQCDLVDFEMFLRIIIWLDILVGLVLVLSMIHFIHTLRKIVPNTKSQKFFSNGDDNSNKVILFWSSVKGMFHARVKTFRKTSPSNRNISEVNTKLIILSLHLSKWLTLNVILMITAYCLILLGFFENLAYGMDQNDPDGCKMYSFYFAYVCVRVLLSHCKIIGLAGPSGKTSSQNNFIQTKCRNKQIASSQQQGNNRKLSLSAGPESILGYSTTVRHIHYNNHKIDDLELSL
eukprot:snap_masked-scaffold_12-processed-gene-2.13-mRNA-1 protein AED:1.00 eAED:1.00 QI:0/0/0/0/1/1/2/0/552